MNCTEAREAMLIADLDEFHGGDSSLGGHLAECDACRRLAEHVLGDTTRLGAALAARRPRARISARWIALAASLPIAAAVIVAISINARETGVVPSPSHSLPVARHVSLTVAPGQHATMIKTADSSVTVIWLTPGGGQ